MGKKKEQVSQVSLQGIMGRVEKRFECFQNTLILDFVRQISDRWAPEPKASSYFEDNDGSSELLLLQVMKRTVKRLEFHRLSVVKIEMFSVVLQTNKQTNGYCK